MSGEGKLTAEQEDIIYQKIILPLLEIYKELCDKGYSQDQVKKVIFSYKTHFNEPLASSYDKLQSIRDNYYDILKKYDMISFEMLDGAIEDSLQDYMQREQLKEQIDKIDCIIFGAILGLAVAAICFLLVPVAPIGMLVGTLIGFFTLGSAGVIWGSDKFFERNKNLFFGLFCFSATVLILMATFFGLGFGGAAVAAILIPVGAHLFAATGGIAWGMSAIALIMGSMSIPFFLTSFGEAIVDFFKSFKSDEIEIEHKNTPEPTSPIKDKKNEVIDLKVDGEDPNICNLFLMLNEDDTVKISDKNHLYLYKNNGKIFYAIQENSSIKPYFLDAVTIKKIEAEDEKFTQCIGKPIACKNKIICSTVLKITSEKGHTLPEEPVGIYKRLYQFYFKKNDKEKENKNKFKEKENKNKFIEGIDMDSSLGSFSEYPEEDFDEENEQKRHIDNNSDAGVWIRFRLGNL